MGGRVSVFRYRGRLFWIVYYAILFGGLAALVTGFSVRWATLALAVIVALQVLDMTGPQQTSRRMRAEQATTPLRSDLWGTVPQHYRHLVLHPTNMCALTPAIDYRFLAVLAAPAGATINA